jgi:hypothetical protein
MPKEIPITTKYLQTSELAGVNNIDKKDSIAIIPKNSFFFIKKKNFFVF